MPPALFKMSYYFQAAKVFLVLAIIFTLSSCKKGPGSSPNWNTSLLTPLLQSSMGIHDLLPDSLVQTNSDNSVSLVFSNSLYHFSLTDQTVKIPDTTIKASFSLQSLNLADKTITYPLSLGQMCSQLGLTGLIIISQNGNTFPIPPVTNLSTGDNNIDATQFFQAADLEAGFIDLTLQNGLPIDISNLVFQVKNKIDQQVVAEETFQNLLAGQTQSKTIDMSGKHVEGTLVAKIIDLDSPGGTVVIDTSDAIVLTMVAHDLVVKEATAVFPSQNLIDQDQETKYSLSGGAELNEIQIKSGTLIITVQSTIPQKSHFEFSLPSAHDTYGNSISVSEDLAAAPPYGTSSTVKTFDLSSFTLDLKGISGTTHNTYYSHLVASIDSTGELVTISKNDSIYIDYKLENIVPEYVSGYLGQQIVTVGPEKNDFDALKNIKGGSINLEDASIDLSIKNNVGVQGRINLYSLTSINTASGKEVPLTWNLMNSPLTIPPATDNPLTPSITNFSLNSSNSNIKLLIENLPDQLKYSLDVFLNPYGNSSNYHDFAYDTSELGVNLDVTIPLSLIATNLILQDTFDFSLGSHEEGDATIKDGTFNLIATNGFPFSANAQFYFLDEDYHLIDSLFTTANTVTAGLLNSQCMVYQSTKSVLNIPVDESKMSRLMTAKKAIVRSVFNTASNSTCSSYIKIYDNYKLDLKLTGMFTYYTGY